MKLKLLCLQIAFTLAASLAWSQGTLYVSNRGVTPTGSAPIGSDSWIAQSFVTGVNPGGYALDSVELLTDVASGSPSGFTVSIYSSPGNGAPGSSLGSLSPIDPTAGGLFSFAASGIMLSPATYYFAVATAATPVSQGTFNWSFVNYLQGSLIAPGDPWIISDFYYYSGDGSSWTFRGRQNVFQFGINATAVPEPSSWVLLLLGAGVFVLFRRFKNH